MKITWRQVIIWVVEIQFNSIQFNYLQEYGDIEAAGVGGGGELEEFLCNNVTFQSSYFSTRDKGTSNCRKRSRRRQRSSRSKCVTCQGTGWVTHIPSKDEREKIPQQRHSMAAFSVVISQDFINLTRPQST